MKSHSVIWLPRGWQPVHVGFCPSEKAWKKAVKMLGHKGHPHPKSDASVDFFPKSEHASATVIVCICRHQQHKPVEIAGLLLHEAVHVWQFCCQEMGEPKAGIEIEAYSIQAIAQELMWAYEQISGRRFEFKSA